MSIENRAEQLFVRNETKSKTSIETDLLKRRNEQNLNYIKYTRYLEIKFITTHTSIYLGIYGQNNNVFRVQLSKKQLYLPHQNYTNCF